MENLDKLGNIMFAILDVLEKDSLSTDIICAIDEAENDDILFKSMRIGIDRIKELGNIELAENLKNQLDSL